MPDPTQNQPSSSGQGKPEKKPGPNSTSELNRIVNEQPITESDIKGFRQSIEPGSVAEKILKKIDEGKSTTLEEEKILRMSAQDWKRSHDPIDAFSLRKLQEVLQRGQESDDGFRRVAHIMIEREQARRESEEKDEIPTKLIHANARTKYSIEVTISKEILEAIGALHVGALYPRVEGKNRIVFDVTQKEPNQEKVTITEKETGKDTSVYVVVIPSSVRKPTKIEKDTPLYLKVPRDQTYFVLEKVQPRDEGLTRRLIGIFRKDASNE
jgi:hypothetical protein